MFTYIKNDSNTTYKPSVAIKDNSDKAFIIWSSVYSVQGSNGVRGGRGWKSKWQKSKLQIICLKTSFNLRKLHF